MKFSLRTLALSAGLLFAGSFAQAQSPAVHGMVIFGSDQLFISHIPMYGAPHDHQALAKVSISGTGLAAYKKYNTSAQGQQFFTLAPKPFVLPQLLNGQINTFVADLYRGSFEQGGRVIATNVTVSVEKIEYQTRLSKATKPAAALTYLTFNDGTSSYLAHKITAPNNFDHIVQIKWLNQAGAGASVEVPTDVIRNDANLLAPIPADEGLAKSFQVSDRITNRLQAGQLFTIAADGSIEESTSADTASFQVVSDFYCTQGPDFFNPCD